MGVPRELSPATNSLRRSLCASATLQRLFGVGTAGQANASIYDRIVSDVLADGEDADDPRKQPIDAYPRCVIDDASPERMTVGESGSYMASGLLVVLLEFQEFTVEELEAWYSESMSDLTDRDHWQHADNIAKHIRDELRDLVRAQFVGDDAEGGYLVFHGFTHEVGKIDPQQNAGSHIWIVVMGFEWSGLP